MKTFAYVSLISTEQTHKKKINYYYVQGTVELPLNLFDFYS